MFDWLKEKEEWTPVDDKGYQYNKEGEARFVGEPRCEHNWENIAERHLKCTKCGDEKILDPPKPKLPDPATPCEHKWEQEQVDGEIYNKCSKCGFMEAIEKTHDCVYTDVQEDGYQHCKICNDMILPEEIPTPCKHEWEEVERLTSQKTRDNGSKTITGHVFIHRCKKCAKVKSEQTHYE